MIRNFVNLLTLSVYSEISQSIGTIKSDPNVRQIFQAIAALNKASHRYPCFGPIICLLVQVVGAWSKIIDSILFDESFPSQR